MATRQRPGHRPGVVFIAADGGRSGPGFAVNVRAGGVGGAAGPAAGRTGAQVRGAGQLRLER